MNESLDKQQKLSLVGAMIAGGLASACCLGPVVVVFLGLGSASAFIAMEAYRPLFAILTLALMAWAGWQHWLGKKQCVRDGCTAKSPVLLWLFAVIALLLLLSPSLLAYFL